VNGNEKFLICDCVGSTSFEIITNESTGSDSGSVRFKGKFQEANTQNKNKRIYSYDILERERIRLEPIIEQNRLFGELDHPADSIIHLENASHLITKLWWKDTTMFGEGKILPTPAGRILETIIRCGIPVGISSRGVGTGKVGPDGSMVIDPSFRLITFDVVADPSTNEAFAHAIGESQKQFYKHEKQPEQKKSQKKHESVINNTNTNSINPQVLIGFVKGLLEESKNSK
jgi:hypothetical protein